jgi:hypothetical protein
MDNMVYQSLMSYFHVLELKGYMSFPQVQKLLVLCFYRDFVFQDYRGILTKDDYRLIEQALDCLYSSTCLIPYPDYLKMSKLHLGEMTEMAQRVKTLEDTEVLKSFDGICEDSDIEITESDTESEGND